jgi:C-terminal peptidase prc
MNMRRMALVLVAALTIAACTGGDSAESTTTTTQPATTTSSVQSPADTTTTSSTTIPFSRELEIVDCEQAPSEMVIFCESYDLIKERYVDEIADEDLAAAATEGLLMLDGAQSEELLVCAVPVNTFDPSCLTASETADNELEAAEAMVVGLTSFALDPNSGYFDPQSLDLLQEEQRGEIEGIGALVSPEDETIPGENKQCGVMSETCEMLIVSTISGAPAEAVGLMRDDEIVAVDGESIDGWTVDEVTAQVRGPAGTDVVLTIERGEETFDVSITRAAVVIPVVEQDVFENVGYVRLWNFGGNAGTQFQRAVVDVLEQGVDELVIDLRNNPGGFLTTAIDVASLFINTGEVVVTEGPKDDTAYPVTGAAIVPEDMEVTFVVNKGSASASEVIAATLQERGRVTVVGENTFGKNTVQQRFGLSNGGALKLTIARWLTPGGLDFGGTGVTPDVMLDVNDLEAAELVDAVTGT